MIHPKLTTACLALAVTAAALLATTRLATAADDAAAEVEVGKITLHVPTAWKQEQPKSRLRLTQFRIPAVDGDKDDAELAVFSFGAGGGVDANIKRWISQFPAEGRKVNIVSGKAKLGEYVLVDISGTYKKPVGPPVAGRTELAPGSRVLAVILAVPEKGNFFLKLVGLDKTVAAQGGALRKSFGGDVKGEKELKLEE